MNASEGRANVARLSLCLLGVLSAFAVGNCPSVARAAAPTPVLTKTSPPSPNTTLTPFVLGSSTGIITSAMPEFTTAALASGGSVTAGAADNTIELYSGTGCEGTAIAKGTAGQLDNEGIQISVPVESTTLISARQVDGTGPSNCSNAIQYKHVKELPPTGELPPAGGNPPAGGGGNAGRPNAPHLRTIPGGWANDNTPLVTGSAPGANNVRIYADPECKGQPVAKGTVDQFFAGFKVTVVDNDVTIFSGTSVAGGEASPCSARVVYVEDSLTPRTRITMGPASKTRKRSAIFRFTDTTGNAPGTNFFCKVDRGKWKKCASPLRVKGLSRKRHMVRVKAIDPAGNAEQGGAKRSFKVVPRP
jgi:hypothetical protein